MCGILQTSIAATSESILRNENIHVDNKIWGNLRKMGILVKMFET
jgi:hypothetical protein